MSLGSSMQDLVIMQLMKDIEKKVSDDPEFTDNIDMVVFMTKITDGRMKMVNTVVTNKQGKRKEITLGKTLKNG